MRLLTETGKSLWVPPERLIGGGYEAEVFATADDLLAKIYRPRSWYPTLEEKESAQERLLAHQRKLLDFPKNLPHGAVGPISPLWSYRRFLFWKYRRQIVGYTMPFIKDAKDIEYYMSPASRDDGITDETVIKALIQLHDILKGLHRKGVVVGDLNHGNVLVKGPEAWIIDLDAAQFDDYVCSTFEPDYVDPQIINTDPKLRSTVMDEDKYHNTDTDWYAFTCMVLACLTYVKPYEGSFPGNVEEGSRPLHRLSVFHPKVKLPEFGFRHWDEILTDDLIAYMKRVFLRSNSVLEERGEFPIELLEAMLPGANRNVPNTTVKTSKSTSDWPSPIRRMQADRYRLELLFQSPGALVPVTRIQDASLRYLYSRKGTNPAERDYVRDHDQWIITGESKEAYWKDGQNRYCLLNGANTISVLYGAAQLHAPRNDPEDFRVDSFGEVPSLSANGQTLAWYQDKTLKTTKSSIAKSKDLETSDYEQNMVWVGNEGTLVTYHSTGTDRQMAWFKGSKKIPISVEFEHNPPHDLQVFEDEEKLWVWSWHEHEIQVRSIVKNDQTEKLFTLNSDWAPSLTNVCLQQDSFLTVNDQAQLTEISLKGPKPKQKILVDLPFSEVDQILSHPGDAMCVITTPFQIWQTKK